MLLVWNKETPIFFVFFFCVFLYLLEILFPIETENKEIELPRKKQKIKQKVAHKTHSKYIINSMRNYRAPPACSSD